MNEEKKNYNEWFKNISDELSKFKEKHSNELLNLEKTYEEKLQLEKPAEFMLKKSKEYRNSFYLWCIAITSLSCLLLFNRYYFECKYIN